MSAQRKSTKQQHFGSYPTFPILSLPHFSCSEVLLQFDQVCDTVVFSAPALWGAAIPLCRGSSSTVPAFNPNKQMPSLKAAPGQAWVGKNHLLMGHLRILQIHKAQQAVLYIFISWKFGNILPIPCQWEGWIWSMKKALQIMKNLVNYINSKRGRCLELQLLH